MEVVALVREPEARRQLKTWFRARRGQDSRPKGKV